MHTVVSRAVELAGHSVTVVLGANAAELAPLAATQPGQHCRQSRLGRRNRKFDPRRHRARAADGRRRPHRARGPGGRDHGGSAPPRRRVAPRSGLHRRRAVRRQRRRPGDFSTLVFSRAQRASRRSRRAGACCIGMSTGWCGCPCRAPSSTSTGPRTCSRSKRARNSSGAKGPNARNDARSPINPRCAPASGRSATPGPRRCTARWPVPAPPRA